MGGDVTSLFHPGRYKVEFPCPQALARNRSRQHSKSQDEMHNPIILVCTTPRSEDTQHPDPKTIGHLPITQVATAPPAHEHN